MYNVLDNYLEFFQEESCGQCTPCRVGCQQLIKGIKAVKRGEKNAKYLDKTSQADRNHATDCQMRSRTIGSEFIFINC